MAPDDQRVLVLYDADCGICMRTATLLRRLDRRHSLHLIAAQAADDVRGAPALDVRLTALHVCDRAGQWSTAGAAVVRIAEAVPALRPLALLSRLPGALAVFDVIYALVAANRHRISQVLGYNACPLGPAR